MHRDPPNNGCCLLSTWCCVLEQWWKIVVDFPFHTIHLTLVGGLPKRSKKSTLAEFKGSPKNDHPIAIKISLTDLSSPRENSANPNAVFRDLRCLIFSQDNSMAEASPIIVMLKEPRKRWNCAAEVCVNASILLDVFSFERFGLNGKPVTVDFCHLPACSLHVAL